MFLPKVGHQKCIKKFKLLIIYLSNTYEQMNSFEGSLFLKDSTTVVSSWHEEKFETLLLNWHGLKNSKIKKP